MKKFILNYEVCKMKFRTTVQANSESGAWEKLVKNIKLSIKLGEAIEIKDMDKEVNDLLNIFGMK